MFTPGTWFVTKEEHGYFEVEARTDRGVHSIAQFDVNEDPSVGIFCDAEEERANARLISASPDMYNALMVMIKDSRISAWLRENDPMALQQAVDSTNKAGAEYDRNFV